MTVFLIFSTPKVDDVKTPTSNNNNSSSGTSGGGSTSPLKRVQEVVAVPNHKQTTIAVLVSAIKAVPHHPPQSLIPEKGIRCRVCIIRNLDPSKW